MSKRTTVALPMGLDNLKHILYAHPRVRTVSTKPYQYINTVLVQCTYVPPLFFHEKKGKRTQTKREEQEEEMKNISKIS